MQYIQLPQKRLDTFLLSASYLSTEWAIKRIWYEVFVFGNFEKWDNIVDLNEDILLHDKNLIDIYLSLKRRKIILRLKKSCAYTYKNHFTWQPSYCPLKIYMPKFWCCIQCREYVGWFETVDTLLYLRCEVAILYHDRIKFAIIKKKHKLPFWGKNDPRRLFCRCRFLNVVF